MGTHRKRSNWKPLAAAALTTSFLLTGGSFFFATADAPMEPKTLDQKIDQILTNTEEIKAQLSITPEPTVAPTTTPKVVDKPKVDKPKDAVPAPKTTKVPKPQVTVTIKPPVPKPPVTTTNPPVSSGTAAERFGWGTPLAASDEFNYTGAPDPKKWSAYDGAGHAGNGRRVADNNTVQDGYLRQTGEANGDSAGLASSFNQQYGRWEARVRSQGIGAGASYHPLLIIWPKSDKWPADGESDFLENGAPGMSCAEAYIHYPGHTPKVQEYAKETNCGAPLSEWHNVAFEWTSSYVKGFIDGKEWFSFSGNGITGMPSGHLTIQLDNFNGSGMQPATYDVDWVHIYKA